jgi:PAS domain S-box-containing protein
MLITENLTTNETLALINTDYETIHIPGAIQAHGLLFVLQSPDLTILQVSSNISTILGIKPEKILGKKISHIINKNKSELIKQGLEATIETINPFNISINTSEGKKFFDAIIHREANAIILELELIKNKYNKDFFSFYHLIKTPIINLQKAPTLNKLYQVIIKEIRTLTEFDRVMVYKFAHDSSGVVIAEDKREDLEPLLGLNYPSFEIPLLSRHLFSKNSLRFIPDTNYQPVPIIPQENPLTKEPLDMSLCVLRSVSNCHIEYLQNMGVSASFVISLMRNDELWGLIACHNYTPKYLPYELRTACEILCKIMALEIGSKEDNENLDYQIKLKAIQAKFVEEIAQTDDFVQGLIKDRESLLELVNAEGAVIYHKNNFICIGNTPEIADIINLVKWLENQLENDIFSTSCLPKLYPEAEKFKNVGSGLLALAISKLPKNYILWFRPEVIQAVNWAGKPQLNLEHKEEGILKLTPRKSFQLWQESVKFQSLPWRQYEIDIALELRVAIVGIVLRKSEQLEKINQQLTLALEAGQMVILDWDIQNNYVVWSNGYQQLFGLKPENPITNYDLLLNSIYYADRERVRLELHQAQIDKTDYHQECRVIWTDQTIHWIESKGKYFYDNEGKAIRMLGTVIEISDRKQAELALIEAKQELEIKVTERTAELKESSEKFRLLTEFSPLGIFLLDKNGKCTYTNPRSHAICGYTFNEALEDGWQKFIHPEDLADLMIKWQQNLIEKTFDIYEEVRYLHKNGTIHYGRMQIAPIFDNENNIKAYVGTVEDITQRYEIEKMKREFISIVSHELRTPLTSIRGSLGLLASGILNSKPEKIQEMLKIASGDTERLVRLVNDILDLERLESHKIKLDKKWCLALNLVQKSIETVSSLSLENNINLFIPENIDNNLQIWADPDRIIQTLVNLISNAIKFSPSDTTITVNITGLADKILFSVQDQGRGIPQDKLETVFGKFQQVDASDSREKGGTGLGLAICRNIIQQHSGKIWAESELGKGSTFYFTIPIPLD